jgi:hypothetical protein
MGDHERGVDLPLLNHVQERSQLALDMRLARFHRRALVTSKTGIRVIDFLIYFLGLRHLTSPLKQSQAELDEHGVVLVLAFLAQRHPDAVGEIGYQGDDLTAYPVSTRVNSPRNQGPQCIEPVVGDQTGTPPASPGRARGTSDQT